MTRYYLRHYNSYRYQQPVLTSFHRLFLSPDNIAGQQTLCHDITIDGAQGGVRFDRDFFTNRTAVLEVLQTYESLDITAWSVVDIQRAAISTSEPTTHRAWDIAEPHPFAIEQWCFDSPHCRHAPMFADYAKTSYTAGRDAVDAFLDLCQRIFRDCIYDGNASTISTTPADTLRHRRGVCQDFAHLAITCLRSIGLPAAYVSGYLETQPPAGETKLVGADASHAWCAVWIPQLGWVHGDPTNGCLIDHRHIITAIGRDFADVSPISGIIYGGGQQQLSVGVDVIPESEWANHPLQASWPSHCLHSYDGVTWLCLLNIHRLTGLSQIFIFIILYVQIIETVRGNRSLLSHYQKFE